MGRAPPDFGRRAGGGGVPPVVLPVIRAVTSRLMTQLTGCDDAATDLDAQGNRSR